MDIDTTHPAIEVIHENINNALSYVWFNRLRIVELTDACNELKKFAMQLLMDEILGVDDIIKNGKNDPVLSCYLDAKVYYFWGEENKAIFDLAGETHNVEFTDDIDCIAFRLYDVLFVFVYFDDLANTKSTHEACVAIQKSWHSSHIVDELTLIDEDDDLFFQNTIPFLIYHIYHRYDYIANVTR